MDNNLVSGIEQIVLRSDGKYSSDSFDRFGDDLTELLLSYLPLEEKFCYECVSKQWKSLIFNKEHDFDISEAKDFDRFLDLNSDDYYYYLKEKVFETIVKKCTFIKHLKIGIHMRFKDNGSVFELIANNCRYLEDFEYYFDCDHSYFSVYKSNDIYFYDKFNEFGDKCGLKIKRLDIKCKAITNNSMKQLLEKTPNVRKVDFNDISVFIESNDEKFLENLNEVKICDLNNLNDQFKLFTDKYNRKVKSITGRIETFDAISVLTQLSRFQKLKVLNFSNNDSEESFDFFIDRGLKMIANNCLELNELSFFLTHIQVLSFKGEIFKTLSHFKSLNSLSIELLYRWDLDEITNFGRLEYLSNIKNLSKLHFSCLTLSDDHFKDIHLYLLNLRSISLSSMRNITEKTIEYLSKMPNLSSLKLFGTELTFDVIQKFIESSLNLSFVEITSFRIPVKNKVINSFINLANKRPKVMLKLVLYKYFSEIDSIDLEKYKRKKLKLKNRKLPKNLIMIVI